MTSYIIKWRQLLITEQMMHLHGLWRLALTYRSSIIYFLAWTTATTPRSHRMYAPSANSAMCPTCIIPQCGRIQCLLSNICMRWDMVRCHATSRPVRTRRWKPKARNAFETALGRRWSSFDTYGNNAVCSGSTVPVYIVDIVDIHWSHIVCYVLFISPLLPYLPIPDRQLVT